MLHWGKPSSQALWRLLRVAQDFIIIYDRVQLSVWLSRKIWLKKNLSKIIYISLESLFMTGLSVWSLFFLSSIWDKPSNWYWHKTVSSQCHEENEEPVSVRIIWQDNLRIWFMNFVVKYQHVAYWIKYSESSVGEGFSQTNASKYHINLVTRE